MADDSSKSDSAQGRQRRSVRFTTVPLDTATLDVQPGANFDPTVSGIVLNESFTGCSVVVVADVNFTEGHTVSIKIAELDPVPARVVWCKTMEDDIKKIGLAYVR
jgi:hypothetical protein